jgi:hypothetical protein
MSWSGAFVAVVALYNARGANMKNLLAFLRALGFALVFLGIILLGASVWMGYRPYRIMKTWPAVDAEVVHTEMYSRTTRSLGSHLGMGTIYGAAFIFRYVANGQPCVSQADIGYRTSSQKEMAKWVREFAEGTHHTIRYDPADPFRISLAAGFSAPSFAPALAFLRWAPILGVVGVLLLLICKRFST